MDIFKQAFVDGVASDVRFDVEKNPAFRVLIRSATIMAVKLVGLAFVTARFRIGTNVVALIEDGDNYPFKWFLRLLVLLPPFSQSKNKVRTREDKGSESTMANRMWRLHYHTLENTFPWLILSLCMVGLGINVSHARFLFMGFVYSRMIHSFIYLVVQKQPFRGIVWGAQILMMVYMAVCILTTTQ